jgi:hypothetical protein
MDTKELIKIVRSFPKGMGYRAVIDMTLDEQFAALDQLKEAYPDDKWLNGLVEPTDDELHTLWTDCINAEMYGGSELSAALLELQTAFECRRMWFGDNYRELSLPISRYIAHHNRLRTD